MISFLDKINRWAGTIAGWSCLLLIILICLDVLMRYLLGFTLIWIIEVEIYLFAAIFLLGSGYAFQNNKHVRVDVFYSKFSEKKKAWTDLFGHLFLLLPWAFIITWVGYNYGYMSLLINEKSAQPGGLPALYILKFLIFIGFLLLILQCISEIIKSIIQIKNSL